MDTFDRMIALAGMTFAAVIVVAVAWIGLTALLSMGTYLQTVTP